MSFLIFFFGAIAILTPPSSSSSLDTFIFGGCSVEKYTPNSPYASNVNLLLSDLVGSSTSTAYNNFTVLGSGPQNTIYGLYQCRGDLAANDCSQCVSGAVNRLGSMCSDASGGVLQLEGCYVKYDNECFFGVEDKTVEVKNCGPPIGFDLEALTGVDVALTYLGTGGGSYRSGGADDVESVAQCVGDLSVGECQDCISEAIGQLKSGCGASAWGDLFLAKCYARFTRGATHAHGNRDGYRNDGNGDDDRNGNEGSKRSAKEINKLLKTNRILTFTAGPITVAVSVSASITVSITLHNRRSKKEKDKPDDKIKKPTEITIKPKTGDDDEIVSSPERGTNDETKKLPTSDDDDDDDDKIPCSRETEIIGGCCNGTMYVVVDEINQYPKVWGSCAML